LFALAFPTCFTWVYFVALENSAPWAQQAAWLIGKGIQFAFPLAWVFLETIRKPPAERGTVPVFSADSEKGDSPRRFLQRLRWPAPTGRGMMLGLGLGAVVAGIMLAGYFGGLAHSDFFAHASDVLRNKLPAFGIDSPTRMIALGVFYSAIHSFLEEYYWRWFVFGQLRRLVPLPAAIVASSLAFMGHHVIVLLIYLPWPWAAAASACVAVGGALWAWLYQRSGSIYAPWLSHLLIDAAIFAIGYEMVFAAR
ncbi:MAG TPA: CPBP family intramembrane glutamic endopeptidase, partial [Pirellulales bacterium]|nr:CPBP family intramembrane glutamic endopeptidase [Pirellulales bacterium]